jgi:hypothetical protein
MICEAGCASKLSVLTWGRARQSEGERWRSDESANKFKMGGKHSALDPMQVEVPDLKELLDRDPYLRPYEREFRRR